MFGALMVAGQRVIGSFSETPGQRTGLELAGLAASVGAVALFALPRPLTCAVAAIVTMTFIVKHGSHFGSNKGTEGHQHAVDVATAKVQLLVVTGLIVGVGAAVGRAGYDLSSYVEIATAVTTGLLGGLSLHTAAANSSD